MYKSCEKLLLKIVVNHSKAYGFLVQNRNKVFVLQLFVISI